jgi:ATP synthase subunit 6
MLISFITLTFSLFIFNIFGMIPFGFTVTSHIIATLFYSFSIFFGINYFSIKNHSFSFFNIFLPKGTPFVLEPLLSYIEIISYFSRVFSLSIRLFANMMAGHALMNIFTSFIFTALSYHGFSSILSIIGIMLIFIIIFMEIIIAFLQVYVFSTLIALYIVDIYSTSHLIKLEYEKHDNFFL